MTVFTLTQTDYATLAPDRAGYLAGLTAPLDGMWENAFLPAAKLWIIEADGAPIGYCAVNDEDHLLAFDVHARHQAEAFAHIKQALNLAGAFASTAEPAYLSLCADHQTALAVNALMYADDATPAPAPVFPEGAVFRDVEVSELETAILFAIDAIGAPREWLTGYYTTRITAGELFGLWQGEALLAAGELRLSPNQDAVADAGMIVGPAHRKQGLATTVLQQLRHQGQARDMRVICSTESSNTGAQKAIVRAGFIANHRLLHFTF